MSNITHAPGTFCWAELMTSDVAAAKEFYTGLFGWNTQDGPIPGGGTYTMACVEDGNAAGMFQLNDEMKQQGVPLHWETYIAVASADDAAARAVELGGTVLKQAFDVMDVGRMAVIKDPSGAVFSVWQAKQHAGYTHPPGKIGTACWNELATDNVDAAGKFYVELFGWKPKVSDMGTFQYTLFHLDDKEIGGMMPMQGDEWKGIPPHWMTYFLVEDCDASAGKVKELGGQVAVPPTDIPNVGRFAVVKDPQGTVFSLMQTSS